MNSIIGRRSFLKGEREEAGAVTVVAGLFSESPDQFSDEVEADRLSKNPAYTAVLTVLARKADEELTQINARELPKSKGRSARRFRAVSHSGRQYSQRG